MIQEPSFYCNTLPYSAIVYNTWKLVVQLLSCVRFFGPHGQQHIRLPCPSLFPQVCSDSCPLSQWCHPTSSSSVALFSFCLRSFPASGSFPMSQLFASGGQSIEVSVSASVLPMNIQGWFPLGLTGLISLYSKDSQESSPAPRFESISGSLWLSNWYFSSTDPPLNRSCVLTISPRWETLGM